MTASSWLPVAKESRALMPTWLAAVTTLAAVGLFGDTRFYFPALLVSGLGVITLGALSVGHEYSNRTLALLLSQPVDRRRVLLVKTGVAAMMVGTLAAVAWAVLYNPRTPSFGFGHASGETVHGAELLGFLVIVALFVAPVLTMACRSAMAGTVFTIVLLAGMWVVSRQLSGSLYGSLTSDRAALTDHAIGVMWSTVTIAAAVGAIAAWRLFTRLEVVEGQGQDVHLVWMRGASAASAASQVPSAGRNRLFHLVTKELYLQQLTLVVGGLYVAWWSGVAVLNLIAPDALPLPAGPIRILYAMFLPLLAGSVASAGERQFGTLEWQVLLPVAMWKQWAVKVGVAMGLAILFGLVFPAALARISPVHDDVQITAGIASLVILAAILGLYASSMSTSVVGALIASLVISFCILVPGIRIATTAFANPSFSFYGLSGRSGVELGDAVALLRFRVWLVQSLSTMAAIGVGLIVLRSALVNHRTADRQPRRLWLQAVGIVGSVAVGMALMVALLYLTADANRRTLRRLMDAPQGTTAAPVPTPVRR